MAAVLNHTSHHPKRLNAPTRPTLSRPVSRHDSLPRLGRKTSRHNRKKTSARTLQIQPDNSPNSLPLSPDINTLIAVGAFWGLANALGQAAVTAYLLDVTPEEHRGSFAAIFNLILGVTTFIGSLIGGYLSDYLTGLRPRTRTANRIPHFNRGQRNRRRTPSGTQRNTQMMTP